MEILYVGLNGSGKSILGKELVNRLNYKFIDVEDYYFAKNNLNCNRIIFFSKIKS